MNNKQALEKLENHKKLISLVSDSLLPIKQLLMNDVNEIKQYLETSNKKEEHK
jgi:hypothetical protein